MTTWYQAVCTDCEKRLGQPLSNRELASIKAGTHDQYQHTDATGKTTERATVETFEAGTVGENTPAKKPGYAELVDGEETAAAPATGGN